MQSLSHTNQVSTINRAIFSIIFWVGVALSGAIARAAPAPMVLPAENVELTDDDGRTITATVLRSDANGITIKLESGQEAHVAWDKLSAETAKKIQGTAPAKKSPNRIIKFKDKDWNSRTEELVRIEKGGIVILKDDAELLLPYEELSPYAESAYRGVDVNQVLAARRDKTAILTGKSMAYINSELEFSRNSPLSNEYAKMDAKSAADFLLNPPTENAERIVATKKIWWDLITGTDPFPGKVGMDKTVTQFFIYPTEILSELNLEEFPLNEEVSLRPEFEKFGVGPMHQSFNELSCQYQSAYKLINFWLSKNGRNKLSLAEFWNLGSNIPLTPGGSLRVARISNRHGIKGVQNNYFGHLLARAVGKQPTRMNLVTGNRKLSYELAKHMLRKGRPLLAEVPSKIAPRHIVLIVGFKTVEGKTEFEVLDHSYYWEPKLLMRSDTWAIWPD